MNKTLSIETLLLMYFCVTRQRFENKQSRTAAMAMAEDMESGQQMKMLSFVNDLDFERAYLQEVLNIIADLLPASSFSILTLI